MIRETNIYYENGVDAVMMENYFGGTEDREAGLAWLSKNFPDKLYGVNILGGLRFKYQPVLSGGSLQEDADLASQRCDAVVATGGGTGEDSPTEKLMEFKKVLGAKPLIVGAGVTSKLRA